MQRMWVVCIAAVLLAAIWTETGRAQEKRAGTYILNISVSGTGRVVGKNIECSTVCSITIPEGNDVVLTAFPAREWHFVEWGGACKEKGDCRILMDGDKTVEAIFTYP